MKKHLEDLRSLDTQSENFTTSNYHRFRAASKYSSPMHDHFKSTMTHFKRFDVVAWAKLDLQICIQFTVLIILDSYALPCTTILTPPWDISQKFAKIWHSNLGRVWATNMYTILYLSYLILMHFHCFHLKIRVHMNIFCSLAYLAMSIHYFQKWGYA